MSAKMVKSKQKICKGLCATPRCKNKRLRHRRFCSTCRDRMYTDPLKRKFLNLKSHARARGKEFLLSFDFFRVLALESGYDKNSGVLSVNLHVDRINPLLGYVKGNVRVITSSENCRKAFVDRLKINGVQWLEPELEPF